MSQIELEKLVREVIKDMAFTPQKTQSAAQAPPPASCSQGTDIQLNVPDLSAVKLEDALYVESPKNREAYMEMKASTPARIGVGRAGPRQNHKSMLRFRADHAAAMDAVFNDVSDEIVNEMNMLSTQTTAQDRSEHLMKPNTGRVFSAEETKRIASHCKSNQQVQVVVADGLSSTAIEANIRDLLPSLLQGLQNNHLSTGPVVFVKFGRVGIMDAITEIVKSEVTILLVGERPGLVTNESLSSYMTYKGYPGMPENARTVVSNIYKNGIPPTEAGAYIADIAKKMIDKKASGLDLNL